MRKGSKFTTAQWLEGLLPEVNSARRVLKSADRLLRRDGPLDRDVDAVLATYSIGVERLMKLALATAAFSRGEPWPSMQNTKQGWGHALDEMDERLREEIRGSLAARGWEHQSLLESWSCTLDNDPVWAAAVSALRNYSDKGRYYHLDLVAGRAGVSKSSREMWDDVEFAAIGSDESLADHHRRTRAGEPFGPFETRLRSAIADSMKRWVSIVCLFGMHGVLGEDWRAIGADALPDDALPVRTISGCG